MSTDPLEWMREYYNSLKSFDKDKLITIIIEMTVDWLTIDKGVVEKVLGGWSDDSELKTELENRGRIIKSLEVLQDENRKAVVRLEKRWKDLKEWIKKQEKEFYGVGIADAGSLTMHTSSVYGAVRYRMEELEK